MRLEPCLTVIGVLRDLVSPSSRNRSLLLHWTQIPCEKTYSGNQRDVRKASVDEQSVRDMIANTQPHLSTSIISWNKQRV